MHSASVPGTGQYHAEIDSDNNSRTYESQWIVCLEHVDNLAPTIVAIKLRLIKVVRTGLTESSEHALRTVSMNRVGQPGEVKSLSTL